MSSGLELRPHHALIGIIAVLGAAAVSLARLAAAGPRAPFDAPVLREIAPPAAFELVDREGRALASSIERLDLVLSPNAMWQAHTPELMAARISEAMGGAMSERELLVAMLPDAAPEGFVRVSAPLDAASAERVERWARTGAVDGLDARVPYEGIWIEQRAGSFELCWDPLIALALAERERHGFRKYPLPWTRHLADRLARCLWGAAALDSDADHRALEAQRGRVWSLLMPTQHTVVLRGLDPGVAPNLHWTLIEEGVAPHQMSVERGLERVHPIGESELLGSWGFPTPSAAKALVAEAWGLSDPEAIPAPWRADFDRAVRLVLSERRPRFGLEGVGGRLVAELGLSGGSAPASFAYRRDRPARHRARAYYYDAQPGNPAVSVRTTLDLELQRAVQRILAEVLAQHDAALCQAIVVDVPTGDVLAIDAVSAYEQWGFAPVAHRFTPGSTFKAIVMAAALEAGLVTPNEEFDVGHAPLPLTDDNGRIRRRIHEAESSLNGVLSAEQCLAHSSNRGMAQIGLRLDPSLFRPLLEDLGYGSRPSIELGSERAGWLPPLPWKRLYTHASLCFGHELSTTLWQHAEALVTVVRGGVHRPLRLLAGVEGDTARWEVPLAEGVELFGARTCDRVRAMMMLGAQEGTGRFVASSAQLPGWVVGTKTGTAEKVPTEICLHAELEHLADGHACSSDCRRTLVGARPAHRSCYTSSMALFGADPQSGREVFVLVVVDEPRGREKYGSKVAGPGAVRILREALGVTRHGLVAVPLATPEFRLGTRASANPSAAPWSEGEW